MRSAILAAAVLFALQVQAFAADPAPVSKGDKVFPKLGGVVKGGDEAIAQQRFTFPWTVQDVNGESLLVGEHGKGWVQRSQVLSLDEAADYYTQLISDDNDTAWAYKLRAMAWRQNGENDLAIDDFGEASRLDADIISYIGRGNLWKKKGETMKQI